ncbi:MAG: hypothetical protein OEN56_10425 [Gemmatimonadota bacterium]|nr:hypothetical protein [Gemmatimonadota bacterium]
MSHVDEGALHAYLDGALDEFPAAEAEKIRTHLDGCSECAERLEVERRIRADAHLMLGLAAPAVDVPSFEEIRAYVQRTRPAGGRVSRAQRLGWAASVVLAIGAGWMLREGQLQQRALDIGQEAASAPAIGVARESEGFAERQNALPVEAGADQNLAADAPDRLTPARVESDDERLAGAVGELGDAPQEAKASAEATVRSALEERTAAQDEPGSPLLAPARLADLADSSDVLGDPRNERADAGAFRGAAGEYDSVVVESIVATGLVAEAETTAAAAAAMNDAVGRADAQQVAAPAEEAAERRRLAESAVPLTSALNTSGRAVPSAADETRSVDDEPLASVPGFEVLDVASLGDGARLYGSRILQRYSDDVVFEVVRLEPGIDPSILAAAAAGHAEARAETDNGWILVRGPLPLVELERLLGRLIPEPPTWP